MALVEVVVGVVLVVVVHVIRPDLQVRGILRDPAVQPAFLLSESLAMMAGTFLAARWLARTLLRDRSSDGLGWFLPVRGTVQRWAMAGAGVALGWIMVLIIVHPRVSGPLGPISQVAARGGLSRLIFAFVAVFIAPPSEELLFRGLLYKGFEASWGGGVASVLVTVGFVAMHLGEAGSYWPSLIPIALMAVLALIARQRTGSLAPSVALHAAYNGCVVACVYLGARAS